MKKLNLNKKGFTLIELLAVIVILALLVAVAVPAVTRYLNTARAGVFANDAATAISAVRNEVMAKSLLTDNSTSAISYPIVEVNKLLESSKNINNSPYGDKYKIGTVVGYCSDTTYITEATCDEAGKVWTEKATAADYDSYVTVSYDKNNGTYTYCIFLNDGIHYIDKSEEEVKSDNVISSTSNLTSGGTCRRQTTMGSFD